MSYLVSEDAGGWARPFLVLASDRRLAFLGVCASEAATFFLDEVDTAGLDGRRGYMLGAAPVTRRLARWHGWRTGSTAHRAFDMRVLMAIMHGHDGLGISALLRPGDGLQARSRPREADEARGSLSMRLRRD